MVVWLILLAPLLTLIWILLNFIAYCLNCYVALLLGNGCYHDHAGFVTKFAAYYIGNVAKTLSKLFILTSDFSIVWMTIVRKVSTNFQSGFHSIESDWGCTNGCWWDLQIPGIVWCLRSTLGILDYLPTHQWQAGQMAIAWQSGYSEWVGLSVLLWIYHKCGVLQ